MEMINDLRAELYNKYKFSGRLRTRLNVREHKNINQSRMFATFIIPAFSSELRQKTNIFMFKFMFIKVCLTLEPC